MPIGEAARVFTLLTIGDGLVAQVPSLLLSTAAAIMATRVSTEQDMGEQVIMQLFSNPRSLAVAAGVIGIMGLIPGMPNVAFLGLAAVAGGAAYYRAVKNQQAAEVEEQPEPEAPVEPRELSWDDVPAVDPLGLEVGYRLIPMVDKNQGGQLLGRLKGVRKKLSQELGFLIPSVHIRDNLDLPPAGYRITLRGATIGQSELHPDKEMAINPGQVFGELSGAVTTDPVFGLQAVWIAPEQREQAQALGYTVVDVSTVIATHLSQNVQRFAHELLGPDEAQQMLDRLAVNYPKLVEDVVPKLVPLSTVVRVLGNLLRENIPIRDMRTIMQVLAEQAPKSQDSGAMTAAVRAALGRLIVEQINGLEEELPVITLDGALEQILQKSVQTMAETGIALEPGLANHLLQAVKQAAERQELVGKPAVLLVPDTLREFLARFIRQHVESAHVLGFSEVPDNKQIRIVASVGGVANEERNQ
jgi:flagellar biosynthesis protein FlhA